jgi:DNA-binding NarL/FixJ family response regulator
MAAAPERLARQAMTVASPASVGVIGDDRHLVARVRNALQSEGLACVHSARIGAAEESGPSAGPGALVICTGHESTERVEAFKDGRARFEDTPIVGIWPDSDNGDERRALKTGIEGLVRESQIEAALAPCLHAIWSGLTCVPHRMRARLQRDALSSREKQILGMLIMGFTNAQIAGRLYLAESTVKSHLSSAYTKLGVRSRKDAAALILDPDEGLGPGILAISRA